MATPHSQAHRMRSRLDPPAELRALAAAQAHVATSEQAAGFGLRRRPVERLVSQGHWARLTTGVFCTRPGEPDWLSLAWAGVLLGGDDARLGGRAAGHLHGLCDPPDVVEVLIPAAARRADRGPWRFIREEDTVRLPSRGEPPRIGMDDCVLDLCAGLTDRDVVDLLTRAVQARQTTAARLLNRAGERARLPSRRLITEVLADVKEGAESPLELRYLRTVERPHELPRGRRQARRGRHVRDVRYDDYATVVELDGRVGHDGLGRFRDMHRDNLAAMVGEVTLRFGWHDVQADPCRVAQVVATVLSNRGWQGVPSRCARCRRVPLGEWKIVS